MLQKGNRNKIVFVGQAPGRPVAGMPTRPFARHSQSGKRLIELSGSETFLDDHDFVNLIDEYPGKGDKNNPHGDAFPMVEARSAARWFVRTHDFEPRWGHLLRAPRPFVMVGANVAEAFGTKWVPSFVWHKLFLLRDGRTTVKSMSDFAVDPLACYKFAMIPHPSGVNRFWNDPANVRRAKKFLRSL